MTKNAETDLILDFFEEIGIQTECRTIESPTFLPGIRIEAGRLILDPDQLKHPGDLLHEAGHVAMVPGAERLLMHDDVKADTPGESLEIGAILWSYAALRYLNLEPEFVFHAEGYKGQSPWMIRQFEAGNYIGLPLLQWMGLAVDHKKAAELNIKPFPYMLKWLRE